MNNFLQTEQAKTKKPVYKIFAALSLCLFVSFSAMAQRADKAISIDAKDVTVKELLMQLEQKSDLSFVYNNSDIDLNKRVSVKFENATIGQILKEAIPYVTPRFENRMVVLVVNKNADNTSQQKKGNQKSIRVSGRVTDISGNPIVGATIIEDGVDWNGVSTGVKGDYEISVAPTGTLVVTSLGHTTANIKVMNRQNINIQLAEDTQAIDEVVVIGYGTQRKATLTGSVTMTSGASLQQSSSVNLSQGMAGRVSGVIVNNRSGEPGADDAIMYIRGRSTLGDNSPLIIIDGIAGRSAEFSRLTGDEIEDVTVLKDASAAIYGSRSANGVILVTTKRGKKNVAPKITFNYDLGLQTPTRLVKMADAVLYTTAYNKALAIDGAVAKYSDEQIEAYRTGSDRVKYPNTDWFGEIIKPVSAQHKYGVAINGGTNNVAYFVSVNGQWQDGIYKKSATNYSQYNIRSNIDVQVTSKFKIGFDISARQQNKNYSAFPSDSYGIFYIATRLLPTSCAYYPNGLLAGGVNPAVMVQDVTGYDRTKINTINSTFTANWDLSSITKGLSFEGHLAYDLRNTFRKNWKTPWKYWRYDEGSDTYEERTSSYWPSASLKEWFGSSSNVTINALLNYNRTFGNHNVNAMVGFEQNTYHYDTFNAERSRYGSSALDELFAGSADKNYYDNTGYAEETARRSVFGRVGYDYKGKYMAQFILRYDGSENFPKGRRIGVFPGMSIGWRMSEEAFIKENAPWLTNLKLRASYGTQGNDKVDAFQYMTTYQYSSLLRYQYQFGGSDVNVIVPGPTPNPFITWEVAKTWNVGLDGEINGGMLNWEIELFKTRRENILCSRNASVPFYTGLTNLPDENIGIVDNRGFEMQLSHSGRALGDELHYRISGNFLYAKNTIVYMDETPWGEGYDYMKLEGHPMGSQLYYRVLGIFKTQEQLDTTPHPSGSTLGDFIYDDIDKSGDITNKDRIRGDFTAVPQIVFGSTISASWRNFDFMMLLQGQARAKYYYSPLKDPISGNIDRSAAELAWTLDNRDSNFPRIGSTISNGGVYRSSFYYSDASFLRLKNLEIGYSISNRWLKRYSGIANLRVYVGGYNLLTFDSLKYVDPETSDEEAQTYPQMKVINMGIKVTF